MGLATDGEAALLLPLRLLLAVGDPRTVAADRSTPPTDSVYLFTLALFLCDTLPLVLISGFSFFFDGMKIVDRLSEEPALSASSSLLAVVSGS